MINNLEISKELMERYALTKDSKDYTILCKKFNRRFPIEKVPQLLDSIKNEYVNIFVDVMKLNKKNNYLENFYSNLSHTIILKNRFIQKIIEKQNIFGVTIYTKRNNYLIIGNKKQLEKEKVFLTPYHELLHLLTTKVDNYKTIRIGFQLNDFAEGLNEGYTELLTKRYFKFLGGNDFDAYIHFQWYSEMLEDIIGKNKMEDLYFSSNLEGLIIELEKYLTREESFNFIEDMELLFNSEDELFDYVKPLLDEKGSVDEEKMDELYDSNKELRDRVYNTFVKINDKRVVDEKVKKKFKEKNDIISMKYDKEENNYQEYFKEENKKYLNNRKTIHK